MELDCCCLEIQLSQGTDSGGSSAFDAKNCPAVDSIMLSHVIMRIGTFPRSVLRDRDSVAEES